MISIPAPARGRTEAVLDPKQDNRFQFPPPRGGERICCCVVVCHINFNSRPREGANIRQM